MEKDRFDRLVKRAQRVAVDRVQHRLNSLLAESFAQFTSEIAAEFLAQPDIATALCNVQPVHSVESLAELNKKGADARAEQEDAKEEEAVSKAQYDLKESQVVQTQLLDLTSRVVEHAPEHVDEESSSKASHTWVNEAMHQTASQEHDGLRAKKPSSEELHAMSVAERSYKTAFKKQHHRYVFSPSNPIVLIFNFVCGIAIVLGLWGDSLALAIASDENDHGPLGRVFEDTIVLFFVLDVLISFNTAIERDDGPLILHRREIAKRYLKSWFIIDTVSTVPWGRLVPSLGYSKSLKTLKLAKLLRVAKMVKIIKNENVLHMVQDLLDDILGMSHVHDTAISYIMSHARFFAALIGFSALLLLEAHIVSCLVLVNSDGGSLDWQYNGFHATSLRSWLRYCVVLRWSAQIVVTGYGGEMLQFAPTRIDPHLLRLGLTLCHACNLLIALSIFGNIKGSEDTDNAFRLRKLSVYLRRHQSVPHRTRRRVLHFLRTQQQREFGNRLFPSIIDQLPPSMKGRLCTDMFGCMLRECTIFAQGPYVDTSEAGVDVIHELAGCIQTRYHMPADTVIPQGTRYEGFFCIIRGRVMLTLNGEEVNQKRCTFFGLESLFAPWGDKWQVATHSLHSIAKTETGLITRAQFDALIVQVRGWSLFTQFIRSKVQLEKLDMASLLFGMSDGVLEEYYGLRTLSSDSIAESSELGVCCEYLLGTFSHDLVSWLSELDEGEVHMTTFAQLRRYFWPREGTWNGFLGSATQICPRDGLEGSAIVDVLSSSWKGKATHFVSWCWEYSVETVVSSLSIWARDSDNDPDKVFLWMCFFCNNQRVTLGCNTNLVDNFGPRLEKIGRMIILLNNYQNPHYSTRVWCIFETFKAATSGIVPDVALPSASKIDLWKQLKAGCFEEIAASLTNIDVERAKASREEDEVQIKNLIRSTIGFPAVNQTLKQTLTKWLVANFEECLTESSVSDVAHILFGLIKEGSSAREGTKEKPNWWALTTISRNLSGASAAMKRQKKLSTHFYFPEWKRFLRQHPALSEFLEIPIEEMSAVFLSLKPNAHGGVHMYSLDRYLKDRNKHDMCEFLLWLAALGSNSNHAEDVSLNRILREGLAAMQDKADSFKKDLENHEHVIEQLMEGRPLWTSEETGQTPFQSLRSLPYSTHSI